MNIDKYIRIWIEEDIGKGDITTDGVIEEDFEGIGIVYSKEKGILAGSIFVPEIIKYFGNFEIEFFKKDGEEFREGEDLIKIKGSAKGILKSERVILNFLMRLSGIATTTRKFVEKLKGSKIKILDTRKTIPGLRIFEKYAVKTGGGFNHRLSLDSGILIKDNHIIFAGGIKNAILNMKKNKPPGMKIEIEVKNIEEAKEAIEYGADILLLDNMSIDEIKEVIKICDGKCEIEVSGGINLENILDYKDLKIDYISIGYLTHSSKWIDLSMRVLRD
ncbi:MAG: carboxylating nicotinate-nucleotide diphosphorylase [candidate division WOR-3 bacterium]